MVNFNIQWLNFEKTNSFSTMLSKLTGRKAPRLVITEELFAKFNEEAQIIIIQEVISSEVKKRESHPGPDEDLSWNKLFSKAITDPETFKHYESETLHHAIVEFFKSIPEMTASPLFCHETLKLFNQHKKAIMDQCDPPVTWSDIIEDDNTRAMYMATFLGDGVAAAAAEEVEDEDEDMEQQEGGNMAGFNEHVEEEAAEATEQGTGAYGA
jgi:hypothetical protein